MLGKTVNTQLIAAWKKRRRGTYPWNLLITPVTICPLREGSTPPPAHLLLSSPLAGWHGAGAPPNQPKERWGRRRPAGTTARAGSALGSHLWSLTAGAAFQRRLFAPNCCANSSYLLDHGHPLESHRSEGLIANSAGSRILGCVSRFKFN